MQALGREGTKFGNALKDMDPKRQKGEAANTAEVARQLLTRALRRTVGDDGWKYGAATTSSGKIDVPNWKYDILLSVEVMIEAASIAERSVDKLISGSSGNDELRYFLDRVAPICERAGGRITANKDKVHPNVWSPFVRWVDEILKCVASLVEPKSTGALGDAIANWKKLPKSAAEN